MIVIITMLLIIVSFKCYFFKLLLVVVVEAVVVVVVAHRLQASKLKRSACKEIHFVYALMACGPTWCGWPGINLTRGTQEKCS